MCELFAVGSTVVYSHIRRLSLKNECQILCLLSDFSFHWEKKCTFFCCFVRTDSVCPLLFLYLNFLSPSFTPLLLFWLSWGFGDTHQTHSCVFAMSLTRNPLPPYILTAHIFISYLSALQRGDPWTNNYQ